MNVALLLLISAVFLWLGIEALLLSKRYLPPTQIEKDEMMFGKNHLRPIPHSIRSFAERRYPFATTRSMKLYGCLFVVVGLALAWTALDISGAV
jgi:hypothetical protein